MVSLARQIMQIGVRNRDMRPSFPERSNVKKQTEVLRECNTKAMQADWFVEQLKRGIARTAAEQHADAVEGLLEIDRDGPCQALTREDEFGTEAMLVAVENYVRGFGHDRFNREHLPRIVSDSIGACTDASGIWGELVRILLKYLLLTMHNSDVEYQIPLLEILRELTRLNTKDQPELSKALTDGLKMFCCFTAHPTLAVKCYTMFCDIHGTDPASEMHSEFLGERVQRCRDFYEEHRSRHREANSRIGRNFISAREESSRRTMQAAGNLHGK